MADRVVKYVIRGDITDLQAKLRAAGASVGKLADEMTKADQKGAKFRKGLTASGDAAGKFGLAAAAGLGAVVLASANFDQAMSNVQAATHETAANMDALREAAIQAGAETAFSASEAAGAIENLAKAGVSTRDILDGGLSGALDLAAAGELEVAQAAEIAATALTQFSLSGSDVPRVADALSAAAGKAQGEVTDMAGALKYVGPVAAQMGLSLEETTGAIAELASQGILGEQAGTSLRGMLTSLTSPSKAAADEMQRLGISMYDARGQFVGFDGIAGQLQATMGELSNAERDAALGRIFGNEQITAARILYAGGAEAVQHWTEQVSDSGYAAETAAIKLDNLRGDFEELTGSLETLLISSGDGSSGFFRSMVQGATEGVNALNAMPPAAKNTATALLGITAITGGAAWFGSRVVQSVANTRAALADLGMQATVTRGMLLKAAAGITGLAVANSELAESTGVSNTVSYALIGTMAGPWGTAIGGAVGATKDLVAVNDDLQAAMEGATSAMETDDVDAMRDAIKRLKREMEEFNINPTDDLWAGLQIAGLEQRIREIEYGAGDLADVFSSALAPSLGYTAEAFGTAGGSAEDFAESLEDVEAVLSDRSALRDYQAALDDFTDGLLENGEAHGIATRAGRANNENLDRIAGTALKVAENLEGIDRIKFLNRARRDFLAAARDMDIPKGKARELADSLGLLEKQDPKITVTTSGLDETQRDVWNLTAAINSVPTSRVIQFRVNTVGQVPATYTGAQTYRAAGGPVYGPGGPTDDLIPAWLSNGEFVMNAKAVKRYGVDMMHRLNAEQFAYGGLVPNCYREKATR